MSTVIGILFIAFVGAFVAGYFLIPVLRRLAGQQIREDGPKSHLEKAGTPSMGGLLIIIGMLLAGLTFLSSTKQYFWIMLLGAALYAGIGFLDDYIKIIKKRSLGLRAKQKIILQFVLAIGIAVYAYFDENIGTEVYIPIFHTFVDFGVLYIPFVIFFLIAVTNSVNLTDGLDGLAGSVSLVNAGAYIAVLSTALFINGAWQEESILFAGALVGALIGFLWYNSHPASVIMGDTGAFFLGGAISMLAIVSRTELLIPIMGIMFLLSSLSSILQVGSYKLRNKKRIFRMAPLHHHFELGGMHETKIVARYTIVTCMTCLIALILII